MEGWSDRQPGSFVVNSLITLVAYRQSNNQFNDQKLDLLHQQQRMIWGCCGATMNNWRALLVSSHCSTVDKASQGPGAT